MSGRQEIVEGFRLAPAQARIWSWQEGRAPLRSRCIVAIEGGVEAPALERALRRVVGRHEILRTAFAVLPAMRQPLQVVSEAPAFGWAVGSVAHLPDGEREPAARALLERAAAAPVSPHEGPAMQATLALLGSGGALLQLLAPAVCADAWTMRTVVDDLAAALDDRLGDAAAPIQYVQFADWQRELADSEDAGEGAAYWRKQRDGGPRSRLPFDAAEACDASLALAPELWQGMRALGERLPATPDAVLLAAWVALLRRLGPDDEVATGVLFDGRRFEELRDACGPFAQHLPVRLPAGAGLPFQALVGMIDETLRSHASWQEHWHDAEAEAGADAPFAVAFELLDHGPARAAGALTMRIRHLSCDAPDAALRLSCALDGPSPTVRLAGPAGPRAGDALRLLAHLRRLAIDAVDRPGAALEELEVLEPEHRKQVLVEFNRSPVVRAGEPVTRLFERRAERSPGAVAVTQGDYRLTYAELNAASNRLARRLRGMGVGPEVRVSLCTRRSPEMLAALLAILKAGGVYVPLDLDDPTERLRFMLADARAAVLVTEAPVARRLGEIGARPLLLGDALAGGGDETNLADAPDLRGAAYVIYTSGSTGRPKGVLVEHGSLADYLCWAAAELVGDLDLPAITRPTFDASLKQLLGPLVSSRAVWLLPDDALGSPQLLHDELCRRDRVALNCVPSLWRAELDVVEADGERRLGGRLRRLLLGGEAVGAEVLARTRAALPDVEVWNVYGPTEATANACAGRLLAGAPVTIGRPVANTRVLLLDRCLRPVPVGAVGRLHIAGRSLARGYPDRPAITADRFVPDPYGCEPGERLYDTGDLARHRPDGSIELLGRADRQVKINGFRVEPEEVEAILEGHPGLREAAVAVVDRSRLAAYVVPAGDAAPTERELRSFLAERLPDYMLPAAVALLTRLPRTATGKLDRAALAEAGASGAALRARPAAQPTVLTEVLAAMWSRLLGVERVGLHESFFELGGHSLQVIQLMSRVRDELGVELPARTVFRSPTLHGLGQEVEEALRERGGVRVAELRVAPRDGELPLSHAQERLWVLDRLRPESPFCNVLSGVRIEGGVDAGSLEWALGEVVRRHEVLRTGFVAGEAGPRQQVWDAVPVALREVDLRGLEEEERTAGLRAGVEAEEQERFDLEHPPLLRASLFHLGEEEHVLVVVAHHLVCDGWSKGLLLEEVGKLYEGRVRGEVPELGKLRVQYADYAVWQRGWLAGGELEGQLGYWRDRLAGLPVLELEGDHPRPEVPSYRGGRQRRELGEELSSGLKRLSRERGVTVFTSALAGFAVQLGRRTGQGEVVIGTPVAGRTRTELEGLVGSFVNPLVLRVEIGIEASFGELVARVQEQALEAYAHQDVPFERLVEELRPERDPSRSPLFQVLFVQVPRAAEEQEIGGSRWRREEVEGSLALYDLTLSLVDQGAEGLLLHLTYARDLYEPETASRLLEELEELLAAAVANPDRPLSELTAPGPAERERLDRWSTSDVPMTPPRACLHELIEAQADSAPDAVALELSGGALTYGRLDRLANALALALRASGVGPEVAVGICLERSPELVVAILAVLKAGGAYVPIDPAQPPQRTASMLRDVGARALVTRRSLAHRLPAAGLPLVLVDDPGPAAESVARPRVGVRPENLAYVISTSGSTGRPKGAMNTHLAVANELACMQATYRLGPDDGVLLKTPFTFDVSVWELLWPLQVGARVVVSAPDSHLDPGEVARLIEAHAVTTVQFVPTMLRPFLDVDLSGCRGLRRVLTIGEALPPDVVRRFHDRLPGVELHNLYGPAEAAVHVTAWPCRAGSAPGVVPIGRPIANVTAHVLDRGMRLAPASTAGELFLGGVGVGRGYAGQPGLTAERFVPDPFGEPGSRVYATGDRARWLPDGALAFLGRADDQLKIRGVRVEPGEVAAVLREHPAVRDAVVLASRDAGADPVLAAYVVAREGGVQAGDLRQHLAARLPATMVPAAFGVLQELPRTPNGKLDRRALPPLERLERGVREYVAPETAVQTALAVLWGRLLGVERVGLHESFFELGGHSLQVIQLLSRVRDELGVELPARAVFRSPTVHGLSHVVEEALRERGMARVAELGAASRDGELPLSYAQERLWFLDRLESGSPFLHTVLGRRVGVDVDPEILRWSVDAVVRRHEALRTAFVEIDGRAHQRVLDRVEVPVGVVDVSGLPEAERGLALRRHAAEEARRPFSLRQPPLLRVTLVRLGPADHVLLLVAHHIVCDGWSVTVLLEELGRTYEALAAGCEAALPELAVQYADYCVWQRRHLGGPVLDDRLTYWRAKLAGLANLSLPADRPRPPRPSYRGARVARRLPRALTERLRRLARDAGATSFMTTFAAFAVLLGRYAGQTDVAAGIPVANRTRTELEPLIGCFVNTLVLRTDLSGNPTFAEVLRRVRESTLEAQAHQDMPFERLVDVLQPQRDLSRMPLVQVWFAFATRSGHPSLLGAPMTPVDVGGDSALFDLTLTVVDEDEGLHLSLTYATDLYEEATAARVLHHLEVLLERVSAEPDRPLDDVSPLTDGERRLLLERWNGGADAPALAGRTVHELIQARAAERPEATAVELDGERLTYGELAARAARLARRLRARGAGRGSIVGLLVDRSPAALTGILAILEAGAAYLPLDPAHPPQRTRQAVRDAGSAVVLTGSALADRLGEEAARAVPIDDDADPQPGAPERCPAGPDDLAYLISTSGSTGTPKGVMASHRNLAWSTAARLAWYAEPVERFLLLSPLAFDSSIAGVFWTLASGGRLVLPPEEAARDPRALAALVARARVSHYLTIPSMHAAILDAAGPGELDSLRTVIVAGEALPPGLPERHRERLPRARLVNEYGVTEGGVWTTAADCGAAGEGPIGIGRPVPGARAYVLDQGLRPVPIGVPGELCLGGAGVTLGYLGRPAPTAERFVPDPFAPEPGARLYRTGDLARYTSGGELVFMGRLDAQVKIRGFRIEPAEVEAALTGDGDVREAAVVARSGPAGDRLTAYLVARAGAEVDVDRVRDRVRRELPEPMVPADYVVLRDLPRTSTGKVDRAALPEPDGRAQRRRSFAAPRTDTERRMVEIWEELFDRWVSIEDDFFALGGNSLLAIYLMAQIEESLGIELPLNALFEAPTVEQLAGRVDAALGVAGD